ncbi:MAG: hypothetical protein M1416_01390 [Candidatus Pacearchaeota archaeon]|nr:hypothetical protein [Candidatus Pacearchaeota archaeon]
MKKPYIKKFGKISNFNVWIVDGKYVRDNIDEEFTNYGQHSRFNFIPKEEFWIDKERRKGEEKYYIESMLVMNRLMAKGVSQLFRSKKADEAERKERAKSNLMKKAVEMKEHEKDLLKLIHKKILKEYSTEKLKVWVIDGETVRNLFFLDFTEGGHEFVYPFVPKGEVWIDDDVGKDEIKFVLLHEMHERKLMESGMKYDAAHKSSSEIEYACRRKIKDLDKELKKEIKKNNQNA